MEACGWNHSKAVTACTRHPSGSPVPATLQHRHLGAATPYAANPTDIQAWPYKRDGYPVAQATAVTRLGWREGPSQSQLRHAYGLTRGEGEGLAGGNTLSHVGGEGQAAAERCRTLFFHLLAAATVTVAVSAHPTRPKSPGGPRRLADTELRRWRSDRHGGQRVSTQAGLPSKIAAIYGSLGDVTRWQTTIRGCRPDEQIALEAPWIQARNGNAVGRAVEAKWHYLAVAWEPNRQWDKCHRPATPSESRDEEGCMQL